VDAWAWHVDGSVELPWESRIEGLGRARLDLDPGAALWVLGLPTGGVGRQSEAALFGRLATGGVSLLSFRLAGAESRLIESLHRRIPAGAAPMTGGGLAVTDLTGAEMRSISTWRFFDAERSMVQVLMVPDPGAPASFQIRLSTFDVSAPTLFDLQAGTQRFLIGVVPDPSANRTTVTLGDTQAPAILEYRRFTQVGTERDRVAVEARRDPPVEEILAWHQAVRDAAEATVQTVLADAVVEFHYSVAGSGATIDVAYEGRYFWDRDIGAEYQYQEFFVNGARWRRKKIPDLPLIQPEKVVTPPLLINMGREYTYRLRGRAEVGSRPAWRIEFEPLDPVATRYAGTAWIDRETYRLLKLSVLQTGLEPPVVASQETQRLSEVPIPEGGVVHQVDRIDGQQTWNTAGLNLVVYREVRFENIRINAPEFAAEREAAWASDDQILRETDQGLRYLVKNKEGEREIQEKPVSRSLFLLGGLFYNEAVDFPIPFAGVNYFDYDFRDRGQQMNLFLAGAANFFTFADPTAFGTRADAAVDLGLILFASRDRYFVEGVEQTGVEVKNRPQGFSATLGYPLGEFVKVKGRYDLIYDSYGRGDDTSSDFIMPQDTFTSALGGQLQFLRRGFTLTADGSFFRRTNWEPWGDPDPASQAVGSRLLDYDPGHRDYTRWSVSASQDVFFKAFEKVRFAAAWLDGSDMDRFSQYQFGFFSEGQRVRGFSGSGIRFDQGGLFHAGYTFNVMDVVSFSAGLDYGRVRSSLTGEGFQNHGGFGLAGEFVGPWGLIMRLQYGLAVYSDVEAVEGEQEIQLLFLRIF
jgi:hypothetical protein